MFLFRLALRMGRTVRELLGSMGSRELSEWMAYERVEPWGESRADLRMGIISSTLANVHRQSDDYPVYKPADFMPRFEPPEPEPELTPEENCRRFMAAFGA